VPAANFIESKGRLAASRQRSIDSLEPACCTAGSIVLLISHLACQHAVNTAAPACCTEGSLILFWFPTLHVDMRHT